MGVQGEEGQEGRRGEEKGRGELEGKWSRWGNNREGKQKRDILIDKDITGLTRSMALEKFPEIQNDNPS